MVLELVKHSNIFGKGTIMKNCNKSFKLIAAIYIILLISLFPYQSRATFSIVAVDTSSGEVGAAGGSCIANVKQLINGMIRGKGAIHTQSWLHPDNMANGLSLMYYDSTAESILTWLIENDADGEEFKRQYGIATLAGEGNSASYTGPACYHERLDLSGPGYAIQGSLLISQDVITNMESAFLASDGPLEEKLMAALNAADIAGADSRCMSCSKPAISAFITVMRLDDVGEPYLNLNVPNTTCEINPLDSIRYLYDRWLQLRKADPAMSLVEITPDTLASTGEDTAFINIVPLNYEGNSPTQGSAVTLANSGDGFLSEAIGNGDGTFSAFIVSPITSGHDTVIVNVTADGETVTLDSKPGLFYYQCGDVNGDLEVNLIDILYLIDYIYGTPVGPEPTPISTGDVNSDGDINLIDVLYLIDYIYGTPPGPEPSCI